MASNRLGPALTVGLLAGVFLFTVGVSVVVDRTTELGRDAIASGGQPLRFSARAGQALTLHIEGETAEGCTLRGDGLKADLGDGDDFTAPGGALEVSCDGSEVLIVAPARPGAFPGWLSLIAGVLVVGLCVGVMVSAARRQGRAGRSGPPPADPPR